MNLKLNKRWPSARFMVGLLLVAPPALANPDRARQVDQTPVRGVIQAAQEAEVSVGLSARISELPYSSGERFDRGAVLVRFDCGRERAEHEALVAAHRALEIQQAATAELLTFGAAGQSELDIAEADVQRAAAEARAKSAQIKDCTVRAPFKGYVVERHVDPFETPAPGAPLIRIIDDGPREIKLIVPSNWLRWLDTGHALQFRVDETGASYRAEVERISRAVDSVSQTVELVARFAEPAEAALPGMSGSAAFDVETDS